MSEGEEGSPKLSRRDFLRKAAVEVAKVAAVGTGIAVAVDAAAQAASPGKGKPVYQIPDRMDPNDPHLQGLDKSKGEVWKVLPGEMPKDEAGNPLDLTGKPLKNSGNK